MKNKILTFGLLTAITISSLFAQGSVPIVGHPGFGGGGEQIKCFCNFWGNCKASGSRSLCAQSEEGGNVNCRLYNGNC